MANTIQFGQVPPKDPAFRIGLGAFTPPDLASQANLATSANGYIEQGQGQAGFSTQTLNGVGKAYTAPTYQNPTTTPTGASTGTYTPLTPNGVNKPIPMKGTTIDFSKYLNQMYNLGSGLGDLSGAYTGGTGTQTISQGGGNGYVPNPQPTPDVPPPETIKGVVDATGIQTQMTQQTQNMSQVVQSMNPNPPTQQSNTSFSPISAMTLTGPGSDVVNKNAAQGADVFNKALSSGANWHGGYHDTSTLMAHNIQTALGSGQITGTQAAALYRQIYGSNAPSVGVAQGLSGNIFKDTLSKIQGIKASFISPT